MREQGSQEQAAQEQLEDLRQQIDSVDNQLCELYLKRLAVVQKVAALKQQHNLPVLQSKREQQILQHLSANLSPEQVQEVSALYHHIFKLSREIQH